MNTPVTCYDFTLPADRLSREELTSVLTEHAHNWTFQLEKGSTTGYEHFQGRFRLKKKLRLRGVLTKLNIPGIHLSPTSKANWRNDFYVTKEETRVDGPWTSEDVETEEKAPGSPGYPLPRDVAVIKQLFPWQQTIVDMSKEYELRCVDVIVQPRGNVGKSVLSRYMLCHGLSYLIPPLNDYKEVMQIVMSQIKSKGPSPCFIFDMPKAINKDKLAGLYSAIESIKSGYAWDNRYKFKEAIFDPPRVIVFTNKEPDMGLLSEDRWRLWKIVGNELKSYADDYEESTLVSVSEEYLQSVDDVIVAYTLGDSSSEDFDSIEDAIDAAMD